MVKITKKMMTCLERLKTSGKKPQYNEAMAVIGEMGVEFKVSNKFHSDTRIPNCHKYELPQGYRIVFQKVEDDDLYLALFVGSHEAVDEYLDNHRGYIFDEKNERLRELRINSQEDDIKEVVVSREIKEVIMSSVKADVKPVFPFSQEVLERWGIEPDLASRIFSLTDTESPGFLDLLGELPQEKSDILLSYATGGTELQADITNLIEKGNVRIVRVLTKRVRKVIEKDIENFIDYSELPEVLTAFNKLSFNDWVFYLHPEQKKLVDMQFSGPARIRGVSGSGKTTVAIHRAIAAAKKFASETTQSATGHPFQGKTVLFLTYNRSLQEYLNQIFSKICSEAVLSHLKLVTFDRLTSETFRDLFGRYPTFERDGLDDVFVSKIRTWSKLFGNFSFFSGTNSRDTERFLKEEIEYIFSKYRENEVDNYLEDKRIGRSKKITEDDRRLVLDIYRSVETEFSDKSIMTPAIAARKCLSGLETLPDQVKRYETVIVDEVQDLTENQLRLLRRIGSTGDIQLFGDGAQKIFSRGFSMKEVGIDITGRSYVLKKNYRNSREIMEVANELLRREKIGLFDEEPTISGMSAQLSSISTEKPVLLKYSVTSSEIAGIINEVKYLSEFLKIQRNHICVMSRNSNFRQKMLEGFKAANIPAVEYRAEGIANEDCIKVSNLHSAKGHEFRVVFIADLVEGSLPLNSDYDEPMIELEASLFYVAMTRAKELLYLSFSLENDYGRSQEGSRFLGDIKEVVEEIDFTSAH